MNNGDTIVFDETQCIEKYNLENFYTITSKDFNKSQIEVLDYRGILKLRLKTIEYAKENIAYTYKK